MQQELDRHKQILREKEEKKREDLYRVDIEREREKRDMKGKFMT